MVISVVNRDMCGVDGQSDGGEIGWREGRRVMGV